MPKSTDCTFVFDSIIFPSGVSMGTFLVRLESALERIDFPDRVHFSSIGAFAFWIFASFFSSSSAFLL